MYRKSDLASGKTLTLVLLVILAAAGAALAVGLPFWLSQDLRTASMPFTAWEQLLEGPPGRAVKLRGRILASIAPSHAGFAAYHKCESYKDNNGNTKWRTIFSDEPALMLELSKDGPSASVLPGYTFDQPPHRDIGEYRYDYIPLDQEVWLLGTLTGYKEMPLETERVDASAGAGPAQKLPLIKADFIACASVEDYLFEKRLETALAALPGLIILLLAVLSIRSSLKRWGRSSTTG